MLTVRQSRALPRVLTPELRQAAFLLFAFNVMFIHHCRCATPPLSQSTTRTSRVAYYAALRDAKQHRNIPHNTITQHNNSDSKVAPHPCPNPLSNRNSPQKPLQPFNHAPAAKPPLINCKPKSRPRSTRTTSAIQLPLASRPNSPIHPPYLQLGIVLAAILQAAATSPKHSAASVVRFLQPLTSTSYKPGQSRRRSARPTCPANPSRRSRPRVRTDTVARAPGEAT